VLFEGNHIENWFIGLRFGSDSQFNIIRNNIIQNCIQKEMVCRGNSGIMADNLGGVHSHTNWRVYNNTFVANNRDWSGPDCQ